MHCDAANKLGIARALSKYPDSRLPHGRERLRQQILQGLSTSSRLRGPAESPDGRMFTARKLGLDPIG
jgi:hypothetical protein